MGGEVGSRVNPDPIDAVWIEIRKAFAIYGRTTRTKLGATRRKILQRHLDDGIELDELPLAVHGYLHQCGGPDTKFRDGQRADFFLRFETVYKIQNMELRVELGSKGPWVKPLSREQQAKARQVAAQKRLDEARAKQAEPRLRAV